MCHEVLAAGSTHSTEIQAPPDRGRLFKETLIIIGYELTTSKTVALWIEQSINDPTRLIAALMPFRQSSYNLHIANLSHLIRISDTLKRPPGSAERLPTKYFL